jgi:hypothetical protein
MKVTKAMALDSAHQHSHPFNLLQTGEKHGENDVFTDCLGDSCDDRGHGLGGAKSCAKP